MKFGVVMDPIESIRIASDSTFAIMLEAQKRGWEIHYMQTQDLFMECGEPKAKVQAVQVENNPSSWFTLGPSRTCPLRDLDIVFMRKDPPFDMEYIYATYILEAAERLGTLVVNKPSSLRDCNEKFFTTYFSRFMPPTLVTKDAGLIKAFVEDQGHAVLKPMDWMGGASVFNLVKDDPNVPMILETFVEKPKRTVMVQTFLDAISTHGDKRIILVDGQPLPYVFTRFPKIKGTPANTARGGTPVKAELSEFDRSVCAAVGPVLKERGLLFSALDVIGNHLTEINVTSPTGLKYIQNLFQFDAAPMIVDAMCDRLKDHERAS